MGTHSQPERTAFVHIGTHKTGTTSLQEFLAKNARRLRRHGLHVPKAGRIQPNSGHHNVAWELSGDPRYCSLCGTLDDLLRELERSRVPDACLSSEDFELLHGDATALTQLRDGLIAAGYAPRVVIFVRPQADYIESAYAEAVKMHDVGWDTFFETVLASGSYGPQLFCYDRLTAAWSGVFGVENVIVRPYDAHRPSGALLDEFIGIVAPRAARVPLKCPPRLNGMLAFPEVVAARERRLNVRSGHSIPKQQRFDPLTTGDIARIEERFAASNARLALRHGAHVACATPAIRARERRADVLGDDQSRHRKQLIRALSDRAHTPVTEASPAAFGGTWIGGRSSVAQPI